MSNLAIARPLADFSTAAEALAELAEPFTSGVPFVADCDEVQPRAMPAPDRRLLAHREHMTVVLHDHFKLPVQVRVQQSFHEGEHYARKIVLNPVGRQTVVEAGIIRMNFRFVPESVKQEILLQRLPLGAILLASNILRRIEPLWFVRFPAESNMLRLFGLGDYARPCFGRLATVFCNEEPAIELLEVVLNA